MPLHPAWVKNIARRVLWAALERDITRAERQGMEVYFEGRCAYCNDPLTARWHADHLVPVDSGGCNHLSNRVPACPRCNEDEKRDMPWERFLERKCGGDAPTLLARRTRIGDWVQRRTPTTPPVSEAQRAAWRAEVEALAVAIDGAWKRLRDLKG